MKSILKRFLKSDSMQALLAWLGAYYIRFVLLSGRMNSHMSDISKPYFRGEHPAIFVLWHNRIMLMSSHVPQNRTLHALVSQHRDGRMIGRVMAHFNVETTYGSTSKGGAQALRALLTRIRAGDNVVITPDGPRGPQRVASLGIAQLAILSRAPVICISYAATRHRRLRSWDRFIIALPFSTFHFIASDPIHYHPTEGQDKEVTREHLRLTIERELNRITDEVDAKIR